MSSKDVSVKSVSQRPEHLYPSYKRHSDIYFQQLTVQNTYLIVKLLKTVVNFLHLMKCCIVLVDRTYQETPDNPVRYTDWEEVG